MKSNPSSATLPGVACEPASCGRPYSAAVKLPLAFVPGVGADSKSRGPAAVLQRGTPYKALLVILNKKQYVTKQL